MGRGLERGRSARRGIEALSTNALRLALFLSVLCAACSSTDRRRGAGTGRVVAVRDLPAAQREVWEAWQRGGAAWDLALERVRADPELARFVVDNLVRVLVQAYGRSDFALPGEAPGPFERAQTDLVELADHSAPVLAELLRAPDGIVAFLAADRLVAIGARAHPGVVAVLDDARAAVRRRAAELLGRLPHAGEGEMAVQERLAARVEKDPDWTVRAESAGALGRRGALHAHRGYAMGVLLRALGDPDLTVARKAAEGLAALGEPAAVPQLARALEVAAAAGRPALVDAIERTLAGLTGERERRSPDGWRAWWDEHQRRAARPPGR